MPLMPRPRLIACRDVPGQYPPETGAGVVLSLVSGRATALNRADLLQKIGKYPPPPSESTVLGLEVAGVVEAVGPAVKEWVVGDRVCALLPGGGYAAKVRVPGGLAMQISTT